MRTLDQRRATHAWEHVRSFAEEHVPLIDGKPTPDAAAAKYGSHVKKLPVRILSSGLGQSLAFMLAKGYCLELLSALGDWVLDKRLHEDSNRPVPSADALLISLVSEDASFDFLQIATSESLAYLRWVVRFAESKGIRDLQTEDEADKLSLAGKE